MTEKDELLMRLGEHVREEQADDARFERVARGSAAAEELAELERAAIADPELATRLEGSRPLDTAAIDRIASRLVRSDACEAPPASAPKKSRRPWIRFGVVLGPIALAASVFLLVAVRQDGPSLPTYAVTVASDRATRGPEEASTRLRLSKAATVDSRYVVLLRPASATKVSANAFAVRASSELPLVDAKVEISVDGAVRIEGPVVSLRDARELRVVLKNERGGGQRIVVIPIDSE